MTRLLDVAVLRENATGITIWSRTRGRKGVDDNGDQIDPLGGVVVDVAPGYEGVDEETGEVVSRPWRYRCVDHTRLRPAPTFEWLTEHEVNLDAVEPPDASRMKRVAQALGSYYVHGKMCPAPFRRSLDTAEHHEAAEAFVRLVRAIRGGVR